MSFIKVKNISKEFKVVKKNKGLINSLKSIVKREYEIKKAVTDISFEIKKGQLVGYVGPNGAGKSTTIKMLTGILLPSKGEITVNGISPFHNRKENSMNIGVVFGQRSQLYWDLPMEEAFEIYKKMYRIDNITFKQNVDFYVELLGMSEFLRKPVRTLSLGQKMRANLTVSLLHNPEILYLDEPTIGLDVVVKNKIRKFIKEINKEKGTTVILTTHDMDDIEHICERLIMLDNGQILYNGMLDSFKEKYGQQYLIIAQFNENNILINDPRLNVIKEDGQVKWISFFKENISTAEAVSLLSNKYKLIDLSIKEPDIEDIVRRIYENKELDNNIISDR